MLRSLYTQRYINRFIQRLEIPKYYNGKKIETQFVLKNFKMYDPYQNEETIKHFEIFNELGKRKHKIELYKSTDNYNHVINFREKVDNREKDIKIKKYNKIYLENHPSYSAFLSGNTVTIYHVIANDEYVKRYKSKINTRSSIYNSDFIISNLQIINPICTFKYALTLNYSFESYDEYYQFRKFFYRVEPGKYNCDKCDSKKIKCNCEQFPTILDTDLIDINYDNQLATITSDVNLYNEIKNINDDRNSIFHMI